MAFQMKSNQRYAKCDECNIIVTWKKKSGPLIKDANCPKCGLYLHQTTESVIKRTPKIFMKPKIGKGVIQI